MRKYYQFGKKHFEYNVREFLIKNRLGFLKEVTNNYIAEGNQTWEYIYTVSTKNKSVEILIFSSLDIRTDFVRNNGADMVRLVLRWKTRSGFVYQSLAHHQRIETLFNNMRKTIENAQKTIFNLNYKEFSNKLEQNM